MEFLVIHSVTNRPELWRHSSVFRLFGLNASPNEDGLSFRVNPFHVSRFQTLKYPATSIIKCSMDSFACFGSGKTGPTSRCCQGGAVLEK
jgi:hypothetical protein